MFLNKEYEARKCDSLLKKELSKINVLNIASNLTICDNIDFIYLNDRKSFICYATPVFDHILTNTKLSAIARLFYLLADCYASIRLKSNDQKYAQRNLVKTNQEWADLLSCSLSTFFKAKRELQDLGYLEEAGETIIPTLPDSVFAKLNLEPNRYNAKKGNYLSARQELDATKQFIKINLPMLKLLLTEKQLNSEEKLLWLYCFKRCYISFLDQNGDGENGRAFLQEQKELAKIFGCSRPTISRALNNLIRHSYLIKDLIKKLKVTNAEGKEKFHSPYKIEALFPAEKMTLLKAQAERTGLDPLTEEQQLEYGLISNRQEIRTVTHCNELLSNIENINVEVSNFGVSSANSGVSSANFGVSSANSALVYKEVIKDHISKNSTRDPNFCRVLEKKTVTSSQGKILEQRKSQNDLNTIPTATIGVVDTVVTEQPSEQLITATPVDKEKIRQRLQATREKLALLQNKTKSTKNILLQSEEALPQPELSTVAEEAKEQSLKLENLVTKENNLHDFLAIKAKYLAAIDKQKLEGKPKKNKNDDFAANLASESSETTCTILVAKLDPTTTQVNTIMGNAQSISNIISFPLNCSDDQLVVRQENIHPNDWENPFHHYLYADLYHRICKDLSAINQQLAERYAKALSKKFPQKYKFWDSLFYEFKYYAATYKPRDFIPRDPEKVALVNAWQLVINGKWQTPKVLARLKTLTREMQHYIEKYLEIGHRAKTEDLFLLLEEINKIQGCKSSLESMLEMYRKLGKQQIGIAN